MTSKTRPTPTIPDGGLFSVYGEVTVDAPAEKVYNALRDPESYGKWSTFVTHAEIASQPSTHKDSKLLHPGTMMKYKVQMNPSYKTDSSERGGIVSDPPKSSDPNGTVYRVCWTFGNSLLMPAWFLRTERVNEIEKVSEDKCIMRAWHTFAGAAGRLVKARVESDMIQRLKEWPEELKKYVESEQQTTSTQENVQA